jgi:hypothetical protein
MYDHRQSPNAEYVDRFGQARIDPKRRSVRVACVATGVDLRRRYGVLIGR